MESEMQKIFDRFSTDLTLYLCICPEKQKKEIALPVSDIIYTLVLQRFFPKQYYLLPSAIVESQDSFIQKRQRFYSFCVHFDNISGEKSKFHI